MTLLENASIGALLPPLDLLQVVTNAVGSSIQLMNRVLAINVHGSDIFQQPKQFPKQVLDRSMVLDRITTAARSQLHPCYRQLLPPSLLDRQHLNEWRETADYGATTLALLGGIFSFETGFKSPLLGGSQLAQSAASPVP
jgi:hypothetical protein